jgi:hypothetical protein
MAGINADSERYASHKAHLKPKPPVYDKTYLDTVKDDPSKTTRYRSRINNAVRDAIHTVRMDYDEEYAKWSRGRNYWCIIKTDVRPTQPAGMIKNAAWAYANPELFDASTGITMHFLRIFIDFGVVFGSFCFLFRGCSLLTTVVLGKPCRFRPVLSK